MIVDLFGVVGAIGALAARQYDEIGCKSVARLGDSHWGAIGSIPSPEAMQNLCRVQQEETRLIQTVVVEAGASLDTRCYQRTPSPVPHRRCRNRSHGANSALSASRPITTITSMMAITCSIAFSSRP